MPSVNRLTLPSAPIKRQIASKAAWNETRSAKAADFFTLGYSGRTIQEILVALKQHCVGTLLDVRRNPVSMHRPELSKRNLARLLRENGIEYAHAPELGVPRDIRTKAIESGCREVIWDWYDKNVVTQHPDLSEFVRRFERPVAMMCTELDPRECHRHRLSLALEGRGLSGFDI